MANEFPQFQETQPVLKAPQVNSSAQGYEAFAKTLGALSGATAEKAASLAQDESSAMYLNHVANAEQVKTSAQIQMLEHPDQAAHISELTEKTLDSIKESSFVNSKDRSKLDAYLSGVNDDVRLKATVTEVRQRQHETAYTYFANSADKQKAYYNALLHNPELAEQLSDAHGKELQGMVSLGALTPIQAYGELKQYSALTDKARRHMEYLKLAGQDGEVNALDYHKATGNPTDNTPQTGAPINGDTQWLMTHHAADMSFAGLKADTIDGRFNAEAFDNASPAQQDEVLLQMGGVNDANAMINSGEPFPKIQKAYNDLTQKHEVLSYRDQGKRDRLAKYINELSNGNYLQVMAQTPAGDAILQNYNSRNSAIENSAMSEADKAAQHIRNKDSMIDNAVAYGQAHHIPDEYIQPIPAPEIAVVQNAFKVGQDAGAALEILKSYSPRNQMYVANAMKNPREKVVMQTIALAGANMTDADSRNFIAANQDGRGYAALALTPENKATADYIKDSINVSIKDSLKVIAAQNNTQDGVTLNSALINAGMNYAKFISEKNQEFTMQQDSGFFSSVENISKTAELINRAYKPLSGANYIVNANQVKLTQREMDNIAQVAIDEAKDYVRSNVSPANFAALESQTSLTVSVTPTNMIQVKDSTDKIWYSEPMTSDTSTYAAHKIYKKRQEMETELHGYFRPIWRTGALSAESK